MSVFTNGLRLIAITYIWFVILRVLNSFVKHYIHPAISRYRSSKKMYNRCLFSLRWQMYTQNRNKQIFCSFRLELDPNLFFTHKAYAAHRVFLFFVFRVFWEGHRRCPAADRSLESCPGASSGGP